MADKVEEVVVKDAAVNDVVSKVGETSTKEDATLLGDAKEEGAVSEKVEAKEVSDVKVVVPEKYELKAPEGLEINNELLNTFSPVFKEIGLSNDAAQKLANAYAPFVTKTTQDAVTQHQTQAIDGWNKQTEEWKQESNKILGADAPKVLAFAAKVINKFGTVYKNEDGSSGNRLRDILEETRLGNHPEITKLFVELGKKISSDSFVEPHGSASDKGGITSIYDHPDSKATLK